MWRTIWMVLCIAATSCAQMPSADDGSVEQNPELRGQNIADGIPFLEPLRWGLNEKEVRLAAPEVDEVFEPRGMPQTKYRSLYLSRVMLGDCQFDVRMNFFNSPFDELASIGASYAGDHLEDCISSTRALLMHRFGSHPQSRIEPTAEQKYWSGPITTVFFNVSKIGDKKFLFVALTHKDAPGTVIE